MEVQLAVDSKGRISLPPEIREEMGDTVTLQKAPQGVILKPGEKKDFQQEFNRLLDTPPERTGQPEDWTPEKIKAIWRVLAFYAEHLKN